MGSTHTITCASYGKVYVKTSHPTSLRASSLGQSGGGAGKGDLATTSVISISASNLSMQNADWEMFVYISNLFALRTDWRKSDSSATGKLKADIQITEMKLQALLFLPAARLPEELACRLSPYQRG